MPAKGPESTDASFTEVSAWRSIGAGWRPIFGSFRSLGFSFEWHDFTTPQTLDWGRSFHPQSVELCLNLDGRATVADGRQVAEVRPRTSLFYYQGEPPLQASRPAGERHRFITVEYAVAFLERHLGTEARHLHPFVRAVVERAARQSVVAKPEPITSGLLQLVESLRRCPVFKPAQEVWFRCKALELAAQTLFCPQGGELFCTRQQRAACARAARVRSW